jgi:DNA-3-methyladenine glycosylase I
VAADSVEHGGVVGAIGRRCFGDGDPLYERYHDEEWGFPVLDERGLFERLTLEAFQSGLSWRTILTKRDAFRDAFADFDPDAVAEFGDVDVQRLLGDRSIVRNSAKIEATLANARATVALRTTAEPLDAVIRAHTPAPQDPPPATWADVHSKTPETVTLARELKRHGFRFVGPTTLYALMQACGLVDDHLAGCPARPEVERARRAAGLV